MSYINQFRLQAYEKAFWYYAGMDYTDAQCEFYAKEFEVYALENLNSGLSVEDLLIDFVADVNVAESAEREKERSLNA